MENQSYDGSYLELERALFGNALLPWQSYRNGKPESSVIYQYVCQSVLLSSSVSISVSVCPCVQKFKKRDTD